MNSYEEAVNYIDLGEIFYLQQGNRDDVSCYSFDELMRELMS